MKHNAHSPEDLVVLARRGRLRTEQYQLLEHALQSSATLRVAARVGRAFDDVAQVHEGDEQRIVDWVDTVVARRRALRPWLGWRLALVAAMVFVATTAAGVVGWRFAPRLREGVAPGTASASVATPRARTERQVALEAPIPTDAAPPTPTLASANPSKEGLVAPPAAPGRILSTAAETPGELLSRANAARRNALQEQAVALYVELQRSFPGSAEANMSLVSLGRLMLAQGQAGQALTQFSQYLEVGGSLQEEALLGKAQALARLQRRSEERAVWRVLLSRYPQSVYAVEAKEHLGEP